jgi:hypothetical protein
LYRKRTDSNRPGWPELLQYGAAASACFSLRRLIDIERIEEGCPNAETSAPDGTATLKRRSIRRESAIWI